MDSPSSSGFEVLTLFTYLSILFFTKRKIIDPTILRHVAREVFSKPEKKNRAREIISIFSSISIMKTDFKKK